MTLNHDGRTYEMGTAYGHLAIGVDDLDETLGRLKDHGIEPEREPYRVREGGSRICFVRDPETARKELRALNTVPDDPDRVVRLLSGGNQQKVVLARWLLRSRAPPG